MPKKMKYAKCAQKASKRTKKIAQKVTLFLKFKIKKINIDSSTNFNITDLVDIIKSFYNKNLIEFKNLQEQSFETWKNNFNAADNFSKFVKTIQDL